MKDITKAVDFMIKTANDNSHGYDQAHRNGPDYDCSSLVATALNKAGFNVSPNSWTGNLKSQLLSCGFISCVAPWKAGDIHLNEQNHVCMSINESQIAQASINEYGNIVGGITGDQTGKEIWIREYYDYPWDCHLRYAGSDNIDLTYIAKQVILGKYGNGSERKQKLEREGYNYSEVQKVVNSMLNGEIKADNYSVAKDVINGKYGNGKNRKEKLEQAGYDYYLIQSIVNSILRG